MHFRRTNFHSCHWLRKYNNFQIYGIWPVWSAVYLISKHVQQEILYARWNGMTALMLASKYGHTDTVKVLIAADGVHVSKICED